MEEESLESKCNQDRETATRKIRESVEALMNRRLLLMTFEQKRNIIQNMLYAFYSITNNNKINLKHRSVSIEEEKIKRLINILSDEINSFYGNHSYTEYLGNIWDILSSVFRRDIIKCADNICDFLQENTTLRSSLLTHASNCIQFGMQFSFYELILYPIGFLNALCSTDGECQLIVGRTRNLIQNVINVLAYRITNGENDTIDNQSVSAACSFLINLLGRCLQDDVHNVEVFLNYNGLVTIESVLSILIVNIPSGQSFHDEYSTINQSLYLLSSAFLGLGQYLDTVDEVIRQRVEFEFNHERVLNIARIVIFFFDKVTLDTALASALIAVINNFCKFLMSNDKKREIETFLLFRRLSNCNIVIHLIRMSLNNNLKHLYDKVWDIIDWAKVSTGSEELHLSIESELDQNIIRNDIISEDLNHCEYPTCNASSNLCKSLLLCGGCKLVYYCGKEHQKLHWKTHKLDCKKK